MTTSTASTQSLFLARLEQRLADRKLTLAVDYEYANRGVVRSYKGDLSLVSQLRFDFQTTGAAFKLFNGNLFATVTYGEPRKAGQIEAVKGSVPELLEAVVAFLS